jgi:drug/metabolite transporter (DMT)-like permease
MAILLQVYCADLGLRSSAVWFSGNGQEGSITLRPVQFWLGWLCFLGGSDASGDAWQISSRCWGGVALALDDAFHACAERPIQLGDRAVGNLLAAGVGVPFLLTAEVVPSDWAIVGFLGIFQLGIPFLFYTVAIRSLSAIETILISCLEPILNPLLVFWVVGELPGPLARGGGIVVWGPCCCGGSFLCSVLPACVHCRNQLCAAAVKERLCHERGQNCGCGR